MKETSLIFKLPLKRFSAPKKDTLSHLFPWRRRYFAWLFTWRKCSIQEFGGHRVNSTYRLSIFRFQIFELHRDEYHDRSDKERADEYLTKWSKCEKELQMFRIAKLGEDMAPEVKKLMDEAFGVNFDEGTTR